MTDAKTQLVQIWLTKAQHDLASAQVLATANPPFWIQPFITVSRRQKRLSRDTWPFVTMTSIAPTMLSY